MFNNSRQFLREARVKRFMKVIIPDLPFDLELKLLAKGLKTFYVFYELEW